MPNLFTDIETSLDHVREGWCTVDKAKTLAASVLAIRPGTVVQIGVWAGRSLIPMALACQSVHKGIVIGIDPWSPDASAEGQIGENLAWWKDVAPHESI